MKKLLLTLFIAFSVYFAFSQTQNPYSIQLQNSYRHEAIVAPVPMTTPTFFVRSKQLITKIEVINLLGKTIYTKKIVNYTFEPIEIDLPQSIQKGIYFVKITFDDNQFIIKKTIYR